MKDYLIVGAGLSGTCLAYRLEKAGKSFIMYDDGNQKASKVAGGLMNPVVLKRFTMAWNAADQLEKAVSLYREMEKDLGSSFLSPLEVYRRFSSIEEQNNWFEAADHPRLAPFLDTELKASVNKNLTSRFSFGRVKGTYRLDVKTLLEKYSDHLEEKGILKKENFDSAHLQITSEGILYKNMPAKNVIFCEGFGVHNNAFFNYLPVRGNKGEYITVKAPGLDLQEAVKSSIFILPEGNDLYTVGATYNNHDKSPEPSAAAREELLNKLRDLVKVKFEVVDQVAGIRPATIDRRPLAGRHPEFQNLYTCNGFGSRGILIAPSISEELLNFIETGKELDPEVDISRFTRKYYKKS